jgi:outer membrane lipoprotein carrier protein
MNTRFLAPVFHIFLLAVASPLVAETEPPAPAGTAVSVSQGGRLALEQFAEGLETYHATFEQRVLNSDGETEDANSGELWLSRPSLFRWEYGGDFPEVIVADGQRVWIYDISLEQITVKDQSSLANDSPLTLLTDLSRLDKQFEVRDLGIEDGLAWVELRSVLEDAEFDSVVLGLRDSNLELMAMEDAFGLRTEIRLMSAERNPNLSPSLFSFEPPEGVDVVGDVAMNGELGEEEAE